MGELHGATPKRHLEIGVGAGGNEFDGGLLGFRIAEMREENGGVLGSAQILPETESIFDDLPFAKFPDIAHVAPHTGEFSEPAEGAP